MNSQKNYKTNVYTLMSHEKQKYWYKNYNFWRLRFAQNLSEF